MPIMAMAMIGKPEWDDECKNSGCGFPMS